MENETKKKNPGIDYYQTHFLDFIRDFFPEYTELEDFQLSIVKLLDDFFKQGLEGQKNNTKHKTTLKICITSAKGSGKSILIAMMALWGLVVFPNLSSSYFSGKKDQSITILFRNCATILDKSPIKNMFRVSTMKVSLVGDDGKVIGNRRIDVVVINKESIDTIAGVHKLINFCWFDEATTIPIDAYITACGTVSGGLSVIMVSGNTTTKENLLYYIHTLDDPSWNKFSISGYDMKRSTYNLEAMEEFYGERGTQLNDIYICGQFAESVDGLFFNASDIEKLLPRDGDINNNFEHLYQGMPGDYVIGIDPSNGIGGDFTSVIMRCNNYAKLILYTQNMDLNNLAGFLNRIYVQGYTRLCLDCCGVGMALSALLKPYGINPLKIFSQMKPHDRVMYSDYRSELACSFREQLRDGDGLQLDLGEYKVRYSRDIYLQLTNVPFEFNKSQLKVANKSNMSDSPDVFDSLIYTFVGGLKTSNIDLKSGIRDYRLDSRGKLINRNRGNYW